ncbi:uncharacterized protein YegJ (DUF2314 family) [Rhodopirellula rubra]|uniref:Uncharacterized protein YegJ (DUF2314 family) n=1 Tax=Aporhodopirellula rubra TaxID=980271 RepID=A0A7W5E3Z9_9BACT|nr:DUF2314 domain-containing protein [Aporhodopirellula rubra]MBB3209730.1 uncharacterized protein YegJ (DUF2314 family) [Aporhodopirellula rubra]
MKPIFKRPRFGTTSTAFWAATIGLLLIIAAVAGWPNPVIFVMGAILLATGLLIWQEITAGLWIGLSVFGLLTVLHLTRAATYFQLRYLIYSLAFAQLGYECWRGLQRTRDGIDSEDIDDENGDGEEDKPMISLVLLQRQPKYLENMILTKVVESAWGGDYSNSDAQSDDDADDGDGFVVGESPMFVIKAPAGMFLVHNFDVPYWDNKDEVVEAIGELRLRNAVEEHTAWLSVDMLTPGDEEPDLNEAYLLVAKLLTALADEDTLAVVRPESLDLNVWSDDVVARLLTPGAYEELSLPDNAPVIPIADDAPEMRAAIATAQQRWPEFADAFQQRASHDKADDGPSFVVKAKITAGDSTEFIWVDVIGLEPKFVHGHLANDPVALGDLKLGSQVEFPIEDVCDWCYEKDDEPVGLFSLEAIRQIQEAQQTNEQ